MNKEIEKCPFCGSEAKLNLDDKNDAYFIECTVCLASSCMMYNPIKDDASPHVIEKWNTRVPSAPLIKISSEEIRQIAQTLFDRRAAIDKYGNPVYYEGVIDGAKAIRDILSAPLDKISDEEIVSLNSVDEIAVKFYYWWHNQKGSNTIEGFKSFKETDIYKKWLDESLSAPLEKWISVEKEKPEENKFVLFHNGHWTGVGKYNKTEDDEFPTPEYSDETSEYIYPIPTHWQPLPKPPIKEWEKTK